MGLSIMPRHASEIPVVIFCGGKGSRLKEETEFKPKPMVTVGTMPILWHVMKIYSAHGYTKFILCLGYKSEVIKDFFLQRRFRESDVNLQLKDGELAYLNPDLEDWNITFVETGLETLTGERLRRAAKYLTTDRFMVTYGDGVAKIDPRDIVSFHKAQGTLGTITGVHPYSKWGLVETDAQNRVVMFRQKPRLHESVNGGFMVFERRALDYLKEGSQVEEMLEALAKQRQLSVYRHEGFWHAMDTYQDMEYLNKLWAEGAPWKAWT